MAVGRAKAFGFIVGRLKKEYPSKFFGRSKDPFRVLIFTILSQRTRDESTDKASRALFMRYKNSRELARADRKTVEKLIKPAGFYRIKAAKVIEVAGIINDRYKGAVPSDLDELLSLPSVGRKTANCVLVYGFGKAAIPVDTHVHRISNRIGIVRTKTPEETEAALAKAIPKRHWIEINELLVRHGQSLCKPIGPKCDLCPIKTACAFWKNSVR